MGQQILQMYRRQRLYLKSKPAQYVQDLLAATSDIPADADYSLRVGAEINRAAATMILEDLRGGK